MSPAFPSGTLSLSCLQTRPQLGLTTSSFSITTRLTMSAAQALNPEASQCAVSCRPTMANNVLRSFRFKAKGDYDQDYALPEGAGRHAKRLLSIHLVGQERSFQPGSVHSQWQDITEMMDNDRVALLGHEIRCDPYKRNEVLESFVLHLLSFRVSYLKTNIGSFPHLVGTRSAAPPLNDRWLYPQKNHIWVAFRIPTVNDAGYLPTMLVRPPVPPPQSSKRCTGWPRQSTTPGKSCRRLPAC